MSDEENKDTSDLMKDMPSEMASSSDGRVYELGFLLKPTIGDENVPAEHTAFKDLIVSQGGQLISDEMPKNLQLAYTMSKVTQNVRSKFDTAYFGWIKFEMDPEKVLELKKKLDFDAKIIRFLILKTVRENTIAARRFVQKDFRRKMPTTKKEGENDTSAPIDKEEIDKEIDAMIAA